jgi:hypothetical protein
VNYACPKAFKLAVSVKARVDEVFFKHFKKLFCCFTLLLYKLLLWLDLSRLYGYVRVFYWLAKSTLD